MKAVQVGAYLNIAMALEYKTVLNSALAMPNLER
jgi:hypothetical protein